MSAKPPDQIWQEAVEEGERRTGRRVSALVATGVVGGADVMLGVLAMAATSAAVGAAAGEEVGHVAGALAFGLGFVFLVIGRGELFTENFLVPISAVVAGRASSRSLVRLWGVTFVGNYAGILLIALIFSAGGVLRPETLAAAGTAADVLTGRDAGAAFLSAVLGGATMTLLTWLAQAAEQDAARILVALGVGFLLAVASMNHAVVSFGETILAYLAGTSSAGLGDIARTLALAVAGNLVG